MPDGTYVCRSFVPEIKGIDEENRQVTHLISDATVDRDGDVIEPSGWEFTDFLQNPIVLADHRYSVGSIIGRAVSLKKTRDGLFATTEFDDEGLGKEAFRLVAKGLARAFSVGFRATKFHTVREGAKAKCAKCRKRIADERSRRKVDDDEPMFIRGTHFVEQTLWEYSLVAIPANPSAVLSAVKTGDVSAKYIGKFFDLTDDDLFRLAYGDVEQATTTTKELAEEQQQQQQPSKPPAMSAPEPATVAKGEQAADARPRKPSLYDAILDAGSRVRRLAEENRMTNLVSDIRERAKE